MVERHRPVPISPSTYGPQPSVVAEGDKVTATLPTGESVEILLYGATVTSWKTRGRENLWLSDKAVLDGSKGVRGGIPVVFPNFGPPPADHATSKLPQHGFARTSKWEYLGKSSTDADSSDVKSSASTLRDKTTSVRLDFGLTATMISEEMRAAWPYKFSLQYSVTLAGDELRTALGVRNEGDAKFDFQTLLHTYLRVPDVTRVFITGLAGTTYADKTQNMSIHTESAKELRIQGETDRVYRSVPQTTTSVTDGGSTLFDVLRDENLPDLVVWNPWRETASNMSDFAPEDGYMRMLCLEAGAVNGWIGLDARDGYECAQVLRRAFT